MPEQPPARPAVTRAELPDEFTPETVRRLPIATLRRLSDHRNDILSRDEQRAFDAAMHAVMGETAARVSRQLSSKDWSTVRRSEGSRVRHPRSPNRADKQLHRLARRIGDQVDLAEALAPGVDWSFAQQTATTPEVESAGPSDEDGAPGSTEASTGTVADLEQRLTEQVELVEVMSEIAEVSKRTYDLEQQRDLQSTRTVFFGLVVSIAVLVAGWAPLVAADDWSERIWIICLTVGTCLIAAIVYGLVRRWQRSESADDEPVDDASA